MSVQLAYMEKLLRRGLVDRYDIWNFAWSKADSDWLDGLPGTIPNLHVRKAPIAGDAGRGSTVAVAQISYFYTDAYDAESCREDVFVKINDDVVYIDTDRFAGFVEARRSNPAPFLISANVVNRKLADSSFRATLRHLELLLKLRNQNLPEAGGLKLIESGPRLSINFCAWLGADWPVIQKSFRARGTGNDDEMQLSAHIPRFLGRSNAI